MHPDPPPSVAYLVAKRLLDVVIAGVMVAALLPFAVLIAVAIRLDSPGPAIYRQPRLGGRHHREGGRRAWAPNRFTILKLRTMRVDADPSVHVERIQLYARGERADGDGPAFKPLDDPRVTRLGRVLRRWSIDELPQLVNVLRGEMSLVGPRPIPAYEAECLTEEQLRRFCAKAGITGLWQVSGRSGLSFDQAVAHDLEYVDKQSLGLDLRILAKTLITVLTTRGAA